MAPQQRRLADAKERGLRSIEAHALNTLAISANMQGDVVGMLELTRQTLVIYR